MAQKHTQVHQMITKNMSQFNQIIYKDNKKITYGLIVECIFLYYYIRMEDYTEKMYAPLKQEIQARKHKNVYQVAHSIFQGHPTPELRTIQGIALCKLESSTNPFLQNNLIAAYHYYLNNSTEILTLQNQSQQVDLIIGQYLFANRKYQQAFSIFQKLLKYHKKELRDDIETNLMAINSCLARPKKLSDPQNPSFYYLFNKCLCLQKKQRTKLIEQIRKKKMINEEEQKYLSLLEGKIKGQSINQKWLLNYNQFVQKYNKDGLSYSGALKRLQQLHSSFIHKQTLKQQQYFQLNKMILLLQKQRNQQARKIYEGIKQRGLISNETLLICGYMVGKQKITHLQGSAWIQMQFQSDQENCLKLIKMSEQKQFEKAKNLLYLILLKSPRLNKHIPISILQKISKVQPKSQYYLDIIHHLLPLYPLNQGILEQVIRNQRSLESLCMYLKGLYKFDQKKAFQRLFKERESVSKMDPDRLVEDVMNIKKDDKSKNQSSINKKIKKRKRKIRYPKNFDPENPGPLPNPERWLPKWQRKQFRKKRNMKSGKTQGSSNVGSENYSTFQQGSSTSNKQITRGKQKRKRR